MALVGRRDGAGNGQPEGIAASAAQEAGDLRFVKRVGYAPVQIELVNAGPGHKETMAKIKSQMPRWNYTPPPTPPPPSVELEWTNERRRKAMSRSTVSAVSSFSPRFSEQTVRLCSSPAIRCTIPARTKEHR